MKKVFLSFLVASMMLAGCGKGDAFEGGSNSLLGTSWRIQEPYDGNSDRVYLLSFTSANGATLSYEGPWETYRDEESLVKMRQFVLGEPLSYTYSGGKGQISENPDYNTDAGFRCEMEIKGNGNHEIISVEFTDSRTVKSLTRTVNNTTKTYTLKNGEYYTSNGERLSDREIWAKISNLMFSTVKFESLKFMLNGMKISSVTKNSMILIMRAGDKVELSRYNQ